MIARAGRSEGAPAATRSSPRQRGAEHGNDPPDGRSDRWAGELAYCALATQVKRRVLGEGARQGRCQVRRRLAEQPAARRVERSQMEVTLQPPDFVALRRHL